MKVIDFRTRRPWQPYMAELEREQREWDALLSDRPPPPNRLSRMLDIALFAAPILGLIAALAIGLAGNMMWGR